MEEEVLRAKKKAMALLLHNDRTEWQLRDKLARSGFSEEAVDEAVEYVRSFHYIDDERYAVRFVEIYHETRSIKRLRQDLYKRHVPDEYIETAIENIDNDDSAALNREFERIGQKLADMSYDEKQKVAAKLYRKGFRMEDIMDGLRKYE
ncbi:MAG: RecX family transcriptional regulator [Lachnospiraceae bacterium]|nr:RecX family transcriptional regulator [Lachnospiraceae bacterium]MCI5586988.1 RecX family transcriptional regulator [Lachnospiraceae bacterium]